jgi:O-antigen/teichoic acid export membrane protein
MTGSLRSETIAALMWSFVESVGHRVLTLVVAVVLARLLTPEDFGLLGMLTILIALATLIVEGGMTSAIIQKKDVSAADLDTAFLVNIGLAVCMTVAMVVGAPYVSAFYGEPLLEPMATGLAIVFMIHGCATIQIAQMTRHLKFKALAGCTFGALAFSGVVAIAMAANGYGVWSLVAQQIVFAAVRAMLLWLVHPWRPTWRFSSHSFSALFSYGSRVLAALTIERVTSNLYLVAIGKAYGAVPLGFYTRAQLLQQVPMQSLSNVFGRVALPVFSKAQDDRRRLNRGMREAVTKLTMLSFPMLAGMAVLAEPIVALLLGEQWVEAAPLLQLLCLASFTYPLSLVNLNLLKSVGRADLFLRLEIIKQALVVLNIATTWQISIQAMLIGQIAISLLGYVINARYSRELSDYGIRAQLQDIAPYGAATLAMGTIVYLAASQLPPGFSSWAEIAILVPLGVLAYGTMCLVFRLDAFMETVLQLKQSLVR